MNPTLKTKISLMLSIDFPENYECWEDAEDSILQDLEEHEQEEYLRNHDSMIEEWFEAN